MPTTIENEPDDIPQPQSVPAAHETTATAPSPLPITPQPSATTEAQSPTLPLIHMSPSPSIIEDTAPSERTHHVYPACIPISGKIYTDQTGAFHYTSLAGNKYVYILYDYDSNYIMAIPIPSRTKFQLTIAHKTAVKRLQARGLRPRLQRLDNEISEHLKDFLHAENIQFELTPAHLHRRNNAEIALSIYKDHYIAGLCSVDPSFPIHLWCKLLPMSEITLNLLRPSCINPQLSAYAQLYGAFDYNKTPLAPPGIKVLAHLRPENRKSWEPHAEEGFYIGPALQHYRCHRIWFPKSGRERICQTIKWLTHNYAMPAATREQTIMAAAADLTNAIKTQDDSPLLPSISTQTRNILSQLAELFQHGRATTTAQSNPVALSRVQSQTNASPRVQPTAQPAHKTTQVPRVRSKPNIQPPRQATKTRFGRTSFPPLRYQPETFKRSCTSLQRPKTRQHQRQQHNRLDETQRTP